MADAQTEIDLDSVIDRLLEGEYQLASHQIHGLLTVLSAPKVRGNRPGKPVQLQEYEIKYLCTKAREIFINQPILLELEAPIKICGTSLRHVSFPRFLRQPRMNICRRYPRPILRLTPTIRVRRLPPRGQLPFPRRLRRSWQAVTRDHLSSACLQNQISRKLFRLEGQS